MNTLRHNKIATTLSLFALLLIFIAPIVSQALMRHDYTPPAHTQHHHSHSKPATPSPMSSGVTMEHDACGYCGLLSHHPALFPENSPPVAPRFVPQLPANEQRPRHKIATAFYRAHSPRAPPTVI
ncbi:DUF2946 domain-containing protein [Candidatus Symbiopectobacterium sp. NZEC127]|uniref:DUF2946 domain-containing protein n=1 Tax=Candidatus Symbiopectobacterium sp. NZEC127 TaxID=2820472 RepID=UPI0022268291|nr:DUF2946 domain-containing protein [Candidatus Symbiopectobacterium sp. NZEC127]MCW2485555.1 DUF2946 domain-containing protein [Candidatus Symbiopectobacterium sp. NZEC127]